MLDFLSRLFDPSGFPARWRCGEWSPEHGWLHILSDLTVWSAYMAIPLVLVYFVARKKDLPFRPIFLLFTAFILACGTTHLLEAIIFWWPVYRLAGVLKLATAIVSWVTVIALIRVMPRMLAMRTPEDLEREVVARQVAETGLIQANADLERRVRDRTEELTQANTALYDERERFRTTLESIGDAVIATDIRGNVTFLNSVAVAQTGWPYDAAIGQPLETVFHVVNETTRDRVENPAFRALQDGVVVGLANHTILIARDGSEHPIDDRAAPIRDRNGAVAGAVLVFRDVTVQRQAEIARGEQARLTSMRADIATALAATQSKTIALQACCDALVRHLGAVSARIWTLPDASDTLELWASAGLHTHLDGQHSRIRVGQFEIGRIAANAQPHLTNSVTTDPEISDSDWALKEGIVAFAGHPLVVEGRVVGVMALFSRQPLSENVLSDLARSADGIAQYIDRRRADLRLRQSEERYRLLFDANPHPMWVFDRETLKFLTVNDSAVAKYGYTRAEFLARTIKDIRPPEDVPALLANLATPVAGLDDAGVWRHQVKDGRIIQVRIISHTLTFDGRHAEVVLAQDVTDQLRAEEELRTSEEQSRSLVAALAEGVVFQAADSAILTCNASAQRILGLTEDQIRGRSSFDPRWRSVHEDGTPFPGHEHPSMVALRTGRPCEGVIMGVHRPDGSLVWISINAEPLVRAGEDVPYGVVCSFSDITARKALEVQVRQAQKLEAIGQLAGGVAHDFNNLLTVVNGCGELLLTDMPTSSPTRPLVDAILGAGKRGAALTRQLLAFSRKQMLRVEVFHPNRVLADTAKLLTRLLGENISLRLALDPAAGAIKADMGQIDQVIINLAVNARDAMPTGGTLVIESTQAEVTDPDRLQSSDARQGRFVRLAVSDTGTGITPEVQARLFEPFFTTKPAGKGTGLGLATVYGIVRQSGGFITIESRLGEGTTFAVYLPRHEAEPDAPKSILRPKSRTAGTETVLLVEDDEAVRTLATAILLREGYRVEAAEDGDAALAVCDRLKAPPDVVLTDVVMPGMSGRELAETLIVRYPLLKVVFLSGYTADDILRHGIEEERVAFLQKPYSPDSLARFVRQVLDGASKN